MRKEKDKRDCQDCGTRMEHVYTFGNEDDCDPELWQCPKCKKVDVLFGMDAPPANHG